MREYYRVTDERGARRLLVAVLLRAHRDATGNPFAQNGESKDEIRQEARQFMQEDAPHWLEYLFG